MLRGEKHFYHNLNNTESNSLSSIGWDVKHEKKHFKINLGNDVVFLRKLPSSDLAVFKQVFKDKEYDVVLDYLNRYYRNKEVLMIDCGSNIGLSSLYLYEYGNFNLKTVCVEPDTNNFELLEKNMNPYTEKGVAECINKAIHSESNKNVALTSNFRDGREWAIKTEIIETEGELLTINILDILNQKNWGCLDLLKIDVEGAEKYIFDDSFDLNYLKQIKVIALEIHDEVVSRQNIYAILEKHGFLILNYSESTIALNKKFI